MKPTVNVLIFAIVLMTTLGADTGNYRQTIRGRVVDSETKIGLPGANLLLLGTDLGAAADSEGNFRIPNVPVGRHTLKVMYIGYKPGIVPEILVGSGKEVVLNIELEESVIAVQAVDFSVHVDKAEPLLEAQEEGTLVIFVGAGEYPAVFRLIFHKGKCRLSGNGHTFINGQIREIGPHFLLPHTGVLEPGGLITLFTIGFIRERIYILSWVQPQYQVVAAWNVSS